MVRVEIGQASRPGKIFHTLAPFYLDHFKPHLNTFGNATFTLNDHDNIKLESNAMHRGMKPTCIGTFRIYVRTEKKSAKEFNKIFR